MQIRRKLHGLDLNCFTHWSPVGRLKTYIYRLKTDIYIYIGFKEVGSCALTPKYDVYRDECSRELEVLLQFCNLLTRFNLVRVSVTKTRVLHVRPDLHWGYSCSCPLWALETTFPGYHFLPWTSGWQRPSVWVFVSGWCQALCCCTLWSRAPQSLQLQDLCISWTLNTKA